jgi:5-methyltetrahydrofolate--homocysteine methyltransferase
MLIIGERINSSRERVAKAIEQRDSRFIQQEAIKQVEAGADYIDVNAGIFGAREVECLQWLVETVQEVVDKPLCLDSADPRALTAALKRHRGKPLVNSISAQRERYKAILPLLQEHECDVVALCMDDSGIPPSAPGRVDLAGRLLESLVAEGIPLSNIYVDPLVQSIATEFDSGRIVLEALGEISSRYPEAHTICGISNISFGLPCRKQLNQIFLVLAMQRGLDAAIIDPCDKQLTANLIAARTLLGKDEFCLNYLAAYRQGKLTI